MKSRLLNTLMLAASLVILSSCSTMPEGSAELPLSDEPLTGKFVWHDLITDDVEGSRVFYTELLGWEYEQTTRSDIGSYTLIIANGRYIGGMVALADPEGVEFSRWLGYLSVDSVDRAVDLAQASGGEVLIQPKDLPVARAAAITDPDGAVLGIVRTFAGDPADRELALNGEVVWNELLAADPVKMAGFYRSLGGLVSDSEQKSAGAYHTLKSQGRARAGIFERPNENVNPVWLTHFAVSDAATSASDVRRLGGKVLLDAEADFRGGALTVVTDPSGALLALNSDKERRAP